jgi:hypothetical protein
MVHTLFAARHPRSARRDFHRCRRIGAFVSGRSHPPEGPLPATCRARHHIQGRHRGYTRLRLGSCPLWWGRHRSKNRHTDPSPALCWRSSSRRPWISSRVRSGSHRTSSSSHASWRSSGDRLRPLFDFAATLPVSRHRFAQRIAVESPITNCRAAARADAPLSTTPITRTRKSLAHRRPPQCQRTTESYSLLNGNPLDSQKVETALAPPPGPALRGPCAG